MALVFLGALLALFFGAFLATVFATAFVAVPLRATPFTALAPFLTEAFASLFTAAVFAPFFADFFAGLAANFFVVPLVVPLAFAGLLADPAFEATEGALPKASAQPDAYFSFVPHE